LRTRDAQRALKVAKTARAEPRIVMHEIGDALTADALHIAAHCALRGADAIYVATARATHSTLVTLDEEILERASRLVSVTDPATWLQEHRQTWPG
jgi:predicted nucleic acid-binding protein